MQLEVGMILEGKITGITKFGAFVELPSGKTGMVHISEVAPTFVKEIREFVTENQIVKVKVMSISEDGKISLSMKKAIPPAPRSVVGAPRATRPGGYEWQANRKSETTNFEDMMSKFKQTSEEKMSDLKKCVESKRGGFSKHGNTNQPK